MNVLALDWNATRVRAVLGPAGSEALPTSLEPPGDSLPLVIDVAGPTLGAAVLRRARSDAHRMCQSFLPYLSDKPKEGPRWHTLTANAACELAWRKLFSIANTADEIVLTVPDYFRPVQATALAALGKKKLKLPIAGSMPAGLAAASAGYEDKLWRRSALVLDVDGHALTITWVKAMADQVHVVESRSFPHLGLDVWQRRLIDALSDRFIYEHRRDPRDIPSAEQSLFDQLDLLADAALTPRALQVGVQGREWFKHMLVQPTDTIDFCHALAARTAAEMEHFVRVWPSTDWPPVVILTAAAGRLPGLAKTLGSVPFVSSTAETKLPQLKATQFDAGDLGENLLIDDGETLEVQILPPDAPAQAAHRLAKDLRAAGHLDVIAPLANSRSSKPHAPLRIAAKR